jgi:hypothetical protein
LRHALEDAHLQSHTEGVGIGQLAVKVGVQALDVR